MLRHKGSSTSQATITRRKARKIFLTKRKKERREDEETL
jgi:hypothetical protein